MCRVGLSVGSYNTVLAAATDRKELQKIVKRLDSPNIAQNVCMGIDSSRLMGIAGLFQLAQMREDRVELDATSFRSLLR